MKRIHSALLALVLAALLLAPLSVSAEVYTSREAGGPADSVYVAGHPDFYPVEYYNTETGCYEGLIPALLEAISEKTGLDFTYIQAGPENHQLNMAKNRQVELVTLCLDRELRRELTAEIPLFTAEIGGKEQEISLGFTSIASQALIDAIEEAAESLSGDMAGMTVSQVMTHSHSGRPWVTLVLLAMLVIVTCLAAGLFWALRSQKRSSQENQLLDATTGIGNTAYFIKRFQTGITDEVRTLYYIAYLAFDISRTNKFFGQVVSKQLLRFAANVLSQNAAATDFAARITEGGFALAFQCGSPEGAQQRVEQLVRTLNQYSKTFGQEHKIPFCAGIYPLKQTDRNCETVLFNAQQGYWHAVDHHLSLSFSNEKLLRSIRETAERQKQISAALRRREFKLYLQFIVDRQTGQIRGAEALSRWEHPQKGLLSPGQYIGIMEELGSIVELDFYIFREACALLERWQKEAGPDIFLTCNFTRITISSGDFMARIHEIAADYDFDPGRLVMEITEDVEESNQANAIANIVACKQAGYRIALDDVGDGFTSFMNLCDYPLDFVKIDRRIIQNAATPNGQALLNGMVALSHSMNMEVICEGVEDEGQKASVSNALCDYIQGFYYSKTIPREAAEDYLSRYGTRGK